MQARRLAILQATVRGASSLRRFREPAFARLDEPERLAWRTFELCAGQVAMLHPMAASKEAVTVVPNGLFAAEVFRWLEVPDALRPRVWRALVLLFDLEYHDGRDHSKSLCLAWHGHLVDVDPTCWRCRKAWSCPSCRRELAWHDPCGEVSRGAG